MFREKVDKAQLMEKRLFPIIILMFLIWKVLWIQCFCEKQIYSSSAMTSGMLSTFFSILSEASLYSLVFFVRSLILPTVLSYLFIVSVYKACKQKVALALKRKGKEATFCSKRFEPITTTKK